MGFQTVTIASLTVNRLSIVLRYNLWNSVCLMYPCNVPLGHVLNTSMVQFDYLGDEYNSDNDNNNTYFIELL